MKPGEIWSRIDGAIITHGYDLSTLNADGSNGHAPLVAVAQNVKILELYTKYNLEIVKCEGLDGYIPAMTRDSFLKVYQRNYNESR